jgi:tetratricopeptide (TPR) repeat protein
MLHAPLSAAPELHDIDAAAAHQRLTAAMELGADGPELRALAAEASALEQLVRGDLVFARERLSAARRDGGWSVERRVLAAAIARSGDELASARLHIAAALEQAPDHERARLLAADVALDGAQARAARTHLERLLEQGCAVPAVYNRLGLAREALGNDEGAKAAFQAALKATRGAIGGPESPPTGVGSKGDRREAEVPEPGARSADGLRSDARRDAWMNLARLHRRHGRPDRAATAFGKALERAPSDAEALLGRGLARLDGAKLDGAARDFERAAELVPDDPAPRLALGDLAARRGDLQQATARYREAIERDGSSGAAWVKLGNSLVRQSDLEGAEQAFRSALSANPKLAAAHNGLGVALLHQGDLEGAATHLERSARLDERDPNPLRNLALLHTRAGEPERAERARALAQQRLAEL